MNNIKNIVENENKKKVGNASIQKKINLIIKKINNKIKIELAKDVMSYQTLLQSSKKNDFDDKINAFYHIILNKISSHL